MVQEARLGFADAPVAKGVRWEIRVVGSSSNALRYEGPCGCKTQLHALAARKSCGMGLCKPPPCLLVFKVEPLSAAAALPSNLAQPAGLQVALVFGSTSTRGLPGLTAAARTPVL
jgi:hypothetical protein